VSHKLNLILFVVVIIFLLLLAGTAGAEVNCTDAGSDGIADNITIVGNKSLCTTDYFNDDVQLNYATTNATAGTTVHLNDTFYNVSNTIYINNSYIKFNGTGASTRLQFTDKDQYYMIFVPLSASDVTLSNFSANTTFTAGIASKELIRFEGVNGTIHDYQDAVHMCSEISLRMTGSGASTRTSNQSAYNNIFNGGSAGVALAYSNDSVGRSNFHDNVFNISIDTGCTPSSYGLQMQVAVSHYEVHNNTIPTGNPYALRIHGGTSPDNNYYNNTLGGVGLDSGDNTTFHDNIVTVVFNYFGQGGRSNVSVYNNIIRNITYSDTGDCFRITHSQTFLSTLNFTNNVLYGCDRNGIYIDDVDVTVNISNNIIYDYGEGFSGINYSSGYTTIGYNMIYEPSGTVSNYTNITCSTCINQTDPLFNDTSIYSFFLKSAYGRWNGSAWVTDAVTSPAIDAGDPTSDYSNEPEPNGNRINMGAYGNTIYASKSIISQVTGLTNGTVGQTAINISWIAVTGAAWYEIFLDFIHYDYIQGTFYNVTGLVANTTYSFMVRANDSLNNWGTNSSILNVTTSAPESISGGYIQVINSSTIRASNLTEGTGDTSTNYIKLLEITSFPENVSGTWNVSVQIKSSGADVKRFKKQKNGIDIGIEQDTSGFTYIWFNQTISGLQNSTDNITVWGKGTGTSSQTPSAKNLTISYDYSLLGYWKLDNNLNDSSGFEINGELISNNTANYTQGAISNSLYFNGSGYINTNNVTQFNFNVTDNYSISAWIKIPQNAMSSTHIVVGDIDPLLNGYYFDYDNSSGLDEMVFAHSCNGLAKYTQVIYDHKYNAKKIADDQWHYVVVTSNGSGLSQGIKYYVDGVEMTNITYAGVTPATGQCKSNSPLYIGSMPYSNASNFTGAIDDVRVYAITLNQSEISDITPSTVG